jgi:hypothetical protein
MDKETIISKIRKCLALSKSANEHEAAAALKQAQALMAKYGVDDAALLAAEASEVDAKSGAKKSPTGWETMLAHTVSDAFACKILFVSNWKMGAWRFIGCGPAAEIARYAFEVLLRQIKKERAAFVLSGCKRLKTINKTRRADLFCDAWVSAVGRQVAQFAGSDKDQMAIAAYMEKNYSTLKSFEPKDRNENRNLKDKDWDAVNAGHCAGKKAQLNHGCAGQAGAQALLN